MKLKQNIALSAITSILLCSNIYAEDIKQLDSLTVTAQKKEENIQKVPISMTLLDEVNITDRNIETVEEIASYTPNLMFFAYGSQTQIAPSLRGIFSDMEAKTVPTAVYVDGVPVLDGWAMNEALFNIQRIEVLKGPQGTLYGKNAETGIINIHTIQPTNEFKGKLDIKLGSDKKRQINLSASGAIIENKLLAGIYLSHNEKEGFIENLNTGSKIDNREKDAARLNLIYKANDNLEISLINSILKHDDGGIKMSYSSQDAKKGLTSEFQGYNKSEIVNNALKVKYNLSDDAYLESVTTRRDFDLVDGDDWDFTDNPSSQAHMTRDSNTKSYSQELRYVDKFLDNKLDFLAGIFADKKDEKFYFSWSGYPFKRDFDDHSLGIFTHIKYQVSNNIALLTGARYDKETKKFKDVLNGVDLENDYSAFSPKLSLEYFINKDIMTYATIAKGYRAGGYNHMAPKGHSNLSFDKESLINYELGFKSILLDNKLTFNSSIYYMDISDMQVTTATSPSEEYLSNAGKAHSTGLEIEMNYNVNDNLSLFSSLGINETKFDTFKDVNGDYEGNYNPFAPKYNFNLGFQYRGDNGIYARTDLNGYGKMFYDKENKHEKKAYSLVNAKIGYESENYDIYIYAKNLFDKNHDSKGYYNGYYTIYSEPREIGIQLAYRF